MFRQVLVKRNDMSTRVFARGIKFIINPRKPTDGTPKRAGVIAMKCGMVMKF